MAIFSVDFDAPLADGDYSPRQIRVEADKDHEAELKVRSMYFGCRINYVVEVLREENETAAPTAGMTETSTSLTALEAEALEGCYRSDYYSGSGRPQVWSWSVTDACCGRGPGRATARQMSGIISSLVKKGLVTCDGDGEDASITVTEKGHRVAFELNLHQDS